MVATPVRLAAAATSLALAGCSLITDSFLTNEFSGDPFPINVDTTSTGALLIGARASGAGGTNQIAVLELLSPFTLADPGKEIVPTLTYSELTLLGRGADNQPTLPRAVFPQAQLIALHPCSAGEEDPTHLVPCTVGAPDTRQASFTMIIGADTLAGDAIRLRLGDDQIFVLPDIGGDDLGRSLGCDGIFDSPYRGGGTLVISGTELPFGNRRITVQACLSPDKDDDPQIPIPDGANGTDRPLYPSPDGTCEREDERKRLADLLTPNGPSNPSGSDALFVVSTSIGISILGTSAYQRYVLAHQGATPLDMLDMTSVNLPSGSVSGRRATIERIALVGNPLDNALSPCRQLYAHRLFSLLGSISTDEFTCTRNGSSTTIPTADRIITPCKDSSQFCKIPGTLELTPDNGIDVLVVSDDDPTLQALRTELRPDQPEVDGILGTNVLRGAEIDVDYPHDRVLARCRDANCVVRPQLTNLDDRCTINQCVKALPDFRNGVAMTPSTTLPGCPLTQP